MTKLPEIQKYDFTYLLKQANLTQSELARKLGISARAVNGWKETPPKYAIEYLELLIAYNILFARIEDFFKGK